jgi:hypothetical protein
VLPDAEVYGVDYTKKRVHEQHAPLLGGSPIFSPKKTGDGVASLDMVEYAHEKKRIHLCGGCGGGCA